MTRDRSCAGPVSPAARRFPTKSYDGAIGPFRVFDDFTASVSRGEKIALIGRNGAGKTTLLKSVIRNATGLIDARDQAFPIDSGKVTWGHEVSVGYFEQDHRDSITPGLSVIEWLHSFDSSASQEELRGLLGQMLFSGEDALKPPQALPGGDAARIFLPADVVSSPTPSPISDYSAGSNNSIGLPSGSSNWTCLPPGPTSI
jgi:ATPase subunit of ABC transporter with duplicated ATPase domains